MLVAYQLTFLLIAENNLATGWLVLVSGLRKCTLEKEASGVSSQNNLHLGNKFESRISVMLGTAGVTAQAVP